MTSLFLLTSSTSCILSCCCWPPPYSSMLHAQSKFVPVERTAEMLPPEQCGHGLLTTSGLSDALATGTKLVNSNNTTSFLPHVLHGNKGELAKDIMAHLWGKKKWQVDTLTRSYTCCFMFATTWSYYQDMCSVHTLQIVLLPG